MIPGLTLTHDTIHFDDQALSFDELEAIDDSELSVTRTPKSMVLALFVAIVAGLLAYLQAPQHIEVRDRFRDSNDAGTVSARILQNVRPEDHLATAEVAPMMLGLDG
jgi:hypothetical protein